VSVLVEDMSRSEFFFQVLISHVLRFMLICDIFTDSPSYVTTCLASILEYITFEAVATHTYIFTHKDLKC
jgi:hypothetical protein